MKKQAEKSEPVEKGGNVLRRVLQQSLLDEEFDALFRVHVELFPSERQLLRPGRVFAGKQREVQP